MVMEDRRSLHEGCRSPVGGVVATTTDVTDDHVVDPSIGVPGGRVTVLFAAGVEGGAPAGLFLVHQ